MAEAPTGADPHAPSGLQPAAGQATPQALDVLAMPLRGSRLIEASAGTGKTWTLAALYLRLVLGHGDCVRSDGQPLLPAQVLVVTFTRAATRELSQRIRQRLADAAAVFRGVAPIPQGDALLGRLLDEIPTGPGREAAAWRLACAAEAMDAAAVLTLDAWCQRMLRDHVPLAGLDDDAAVQPDSAELRLEAACDYWRQEVYPLDAEALPVALGTWASPQALAEGIGPWLERELPESAGHGRLAERIAPHLQALQALKAHWPARVDEMQQWLDARTDAARSPFSGSKLSRRHYPGWLQALREWAAEPTALRPDISAAGQSRLRPEGLRAALRPGIQLEIPACFDAFGQLLDALDALPALEPGLRLHAAAGVARRLHALKAQRGLRSHLDVQQQLARALDPALAGTGAQALRQVIRARFPAALVDEFQDTSPLQLAILDRLYGLAADDPQAAVLLIGDPKQSIYGFRGADIHSYLRARRATAGRHHALDVNRRSTPALVAAVNALFGAAEARGAEGAFRFAPAVADGSAQDRPLPFQPVTAAEGDTVFEPGGDGELPALTLCLTMAGQSATEARAWHAQRCAQVVVEWLQRDGAGLRRRSDGRWRPLAPGDIAVLVHDRHDAALVRRELTRRVVPSVFLSDRDSVYATPEAADLLRVLRAVENPSDVRLARAALATGLLGLPLQQLLLLADDDEALDAEAERLRALQSTWRRQGVLAAIRALLHGFGLPARWLAQDGGERRLTDVLHLAELLQQAESGVDGQASLLHLLAREVEAAGPDAVAAEEVVQRLESDADRVQVVTVHKSKGLQYPLVFLPFGTRVRTAGSRDWALWLPDGEGQRRLVTEPGDADREAAELDARREDLRLLYVALTRAQHRLWVGASMHRSGTSRAEAWHRSALGYLVSGPAPAEPALAVQTLRELASRCPSIGLSVIEEDPPPMAASVQRLRRADEAVPIASTPPYAAAFERDWGITSYSALARDAARGGSAQPAPRAGAGTGDAAWETPLQPWPADGAIRQPVLRDDEPPAGATEAILQADAAPGDAAAPWHRFPRGALAGDFLHRQLEWLADEGFGRVDTPAVQRALAQRCEREGWGHRADDVQRWLSRVCTQPLPALGVPLQGLQRSLPEMEFWLPVQQLRTATLDALCSAHLWPGQERPRLGERQRSGLLMGFADLVFEHGGRFWVLDYKSNALGRDDAQYGALAMQRAMLEHRYDLQAALYLLALHRLLRARLREAYRPADQLGGALFLFLRGIAGPQAGCCVVPPSQALLDSLDASFSAARPSPGESGR
jgi:exodeoxyribonuclease V beta subunit